jgi:hypothetical protein
MKLVSIPVSNQEEAVLWICKNQLLRSDLTEEMRKYLIGKRCHAEKVLGTLEVAANRKAAREHESDEEYVPTPALYESTATRTCERIGADYHISFATVRKYSIYAEILDHLNTMEPSFVTMVLRGNFRISHEHLVEIGNMKRPEFTRLVKYFFNGSDPNPSYSKYKNLLYDDKPRVVMNPQPVGSIKEMPEFDPDAEVASLALTMPSWTDSIKRTHNHTDFSIITDRARWRLVYELDRLIFAAEGTLAKLKEEQNG